MAGCDALVVMILLSLSQFFGGFAYAGFYNPNILDLAPPFAGTLFGISNTIGNMNGFLAPQPRIQINIATNCQYIAQAISILKIRLICIYDHSWPVTSFEITSTQ